MCLDDVIMYAVYFYTVHVFPPSRDQPRLRVFWPNFLRRVLFLDNRPSACIYVNRLTNREYDFHLKSIIEQPF